MYETLLRMWKKKKITAAKIENAVKNGWITEEQAQVILNTPQD